MSNKAKQKPAFARFPVSLTFDPGEEWKDVKAQAVKRSPFIALSDGVFSNAAKRLFVIASWAERADKRRWLHVSCSHPERVPSYEEMCEVKARFVGKDRKAVMVFPEEDKHVNIHGNCLHLYSCLDDDPLPEFSSIIGGVRSI